MDSGKEARLGILERDAKRDIIAPFERHNWECSIDGQFPNGEYIVIKLNKSDSEFKVGLLYSCATANGIYKILDKTVDLIVLNGGFYHLESYAYGIETEVIEKSSIQTYVIKWNSLVSEGKISVGGPEKPKIKPREFTSHIQSESPIKQIWTRIKQFKTKGLSKKLVIERYASKAITYSSEVAECKAEGLAFCIQNGCDYFEAASEQKLNQRIVSLYYGAIAFASAEMLAAPEGPDSLDEVENMTKFGHGLYTFDSLDENSFEGFVVGVLSNGFFKKWVEFLGSDISSFPDKKPKKSSDIDLSKNEVTTLIELFSRIPELEDLFLLVTNSPPNWLTFSYDSESNGSFGLNIPRLRETYVTINDISCSKSKEDIAALSLPLDQIEYQTSEYPGLHFKALVKHPEEEYWHGVLKQHRSPYTSSSVIIPIFGSVGEYRAICVALLYSLSILVRYRPSIWREVVSGKHENYLALIEEFLDVYERLAPQEFLENLLSKPIHVTQSGSMFASI
ncbi:YaaC family protein [Aeromonas enteropelogenes]|uniref:YaaC family protein n=1 Tax=Aeromonas enteropelogenes TaxID=29489 RepID=UPI0009E4CE3D|nr:YaaC family protein [Aeromonas enteropelogenes]UAK70221.1 YaaC family protein [Aeromonas enteropelogenes]UBH57318.1 YaaC family protein [Aeromonas enteropelogenes]